MTLEKLKALLEAGQITQEEYDAVSKTLEGDKDLEKMIQSAVDRATQKIGTENKELREKLDKLSKEKLSDKERAELELADRETKLAEREKALKTEQNKLYAIKKLKEAGLDDGSDDALSLIDLVIGEDETTIDSRIQTYKTVFDKTVQSKVDSTFKENGRDPNGGNRDKDNKDDKDKNIAIELGKAAAETNKASQNIINQYIGGNNE